MTVYEKILQLLTDKSVAFETLEHEPVHTSADAAKVRDTHVSNGAKALVLVADKKPILAVLPGDKKADFKALKKELGVRDLRMATRNEVKEWTTLEVGSIPPLGSVLGLPSYFSSEFRAKTMSVFNAGSLTTSITLKTSDLLLVENPTIIQFTD